MRVALVTPRYLPDVGGVESHVRQIANHLAHGGDEVDVITLGSVRRLPPVDSDGHVRVRRFPSRPLPSGVGTPGRLARYLRAHGSDYDVVHVHNYQSLLPLAACVVPGSRLVMTPHYHATSPSRLSTALRSVYRPVGGRTICRAERVICVSHAERQLVQAELGVAPDALTVIPNGVDAAALRRAEPFPITTPVVLVLGRVERYKRVDRVIKAMALVRQPAQLVVVGDGEARSALERLATELGVGASTVRFVGRADDHDVRRWLATARVVVTLSEIEAFGLTVIEGLTSGSRVVASDIPAFREVAASLPGAAIRLVPADADAARIAEYLHTALADPGPPPTVTGVEWSEVARRTREVYLEVIAGARNGAGNRRR